MKHMQNVIPSFYVVFNPFFFCHYFWYQSSVFFFSFLVIQFYTRVTGSLCLLMICSQNIQHWLLKEKRKILKKFLFILSICKISLSKFNILHLKESNLLFWELESEDHPSMRILLSHLHLQANQLQIDLLYPMGGGIKMLNNLIFKNLW